MASLSANDSKRAYQFIKQRAERIVNENVAAYKQNIATTIDYELIMMKKEIRDGNDMAAGQHKMRAEIYQSILERI